MIVSLIKSLSKEIQGISKLDKTSARARARTYLFIMMSVIIGTLIITLGVVINNAVHTSEAYIKLKSENELLVKQCHSKNQHNESFDSGNGLMPKGFWTPKEKSYVAGCSDIWCFNEMNRKVD